MCVRSCVCVLCVYEEGGRGEGREEGLTLDDGWLNPLTQYQKPARVVEEVNSSRKRQQAFTQLYA